MAPQVIQRKWDRDRLVAGLANLKESELWTTHYIKPYYSLAERWDVDQALDERRTQVTRQRVIGWIDRQDELRKIYTTEAYDRLDAILLKIPEMLAEYDGLYQRASRQWEEVNQYGSFAEPDMEILKRFKSLRLDIEKAGIRVKQRDKLIEILTDFEKTSLLFGCDSVSLSLPDCPILSPTATYISSIDLHSSFLTRYIVRTYLYLMRKEFESRNKLSEGLKGLPLLVFIVALLLLIRPVSGIIGAPIGDLPAFTIVFAGYLAWSAVRIWRTRRTESVLEGLIALFQTIDEPSTIDGSALTGELRILQARKLFVPSLLFSLFAMVTPGV